MKTNSKKTSKLRRIADRFMQYWWCYLLIAFLSFFINAYFKEGIMKSITFRSFFFFIGVLVVALSMIAISKLTTIFKERDQADKFMRYWWCYPLIYIGSILASLKLRHTYPSAITPLGILFFLSGALSLLALIVGVVQNRIVAFFQRHKAQIAYWNRRYLEWMLPLLATFALLLALTFTDYSFGGFILSAVLLLSLAAHLSIGLIQKRFGAVFKTVALFAGSLGLSAGIVYGSLMLCVNRYMNESNEGISSLERAAFLKYVEGKEFVIPDFIQYNILEYATLQYPTLDVTKNGRKVTLQGEEYWEIPFSFEGKMRGVDQIIGTPNVYFTMDGTAVGLRRDDYKWDLTTLVPDNENKLLPAVANIAIAFFTNSGKSQQSIAIGVGKMLE